MRSAKISTVMLLGAAMLSGCVAEQGALDPEASPTALAIAPTESAPSPSDAAVIPGQVGIPVTFECAELLTAEALYSFNPNVGTDPAYTPTPLAQQALDLEGIACGWLNQTSAVTYAVAVAQLESPGLAVLYDAASAPPGAVALTNADGFFTVSSAGGTAQAFLGGYWVVIESPSFIAPSDVDELVQMVTAALP